LLEVSNPNGGGVDFLEGFNRGGLSDTKGTDVAAFGFDTCDYRAGNDGVELSVAVGEED
jgi:hypothetical protein